MSGAVLLTGATGLVGRYLLRELLQAGVNVAVVIRPKRDATSQQRLEEVLTHWEKISGRKLPQPVIFNGDITLPRLGLSQDAQNWVSSNVDQIIHNAASLTFHGKDRSAEPWRSNFNGTNHVLELCRATNIRQMHYVSTAYVCGITNSRVLETNPSKPPVSFRNDYEESKYLTEQLVRDSIDFDQLTIYRPGTIVGDSQTGFTSTYHAFYAYLQFAWILSQFSPKDNEGRWCAPIRLTAIGNEPRNFVPVEWVSAVMIQLFLASEHHGKTYHLTPTTPVTIAELDAAMSTFFSYYGTELVGQIEIPESEMNDIEQQFYRSLATYQPYWNLEPHFDCTNLLQALPSMPCPLMSEEVLHRLMAFAVSDNWGKRKI